MAQRHEATSFLPLTESTYYVMLTLVEPLHGYAVMQRVEEMSEGTVRLGPGTLYGVFATLEKAGLIVKVKEEERRKSYTLTPQGVDVLREQVRRLEIMARQGRQIAGRS